MVALLWRSFWLLVKRYCFWDTLMLEAGNLWIWLLTLYLKRISRQAPFLLLLLLPRSYGPSSFLSRTPCCLLLDPCYFCCPATQRSLSKLLKIEVRWCHPRPLPSPQHPPYTSPVMLVFLHYLRRLEGRKAGSGRKTLALISISNYLLSWLFTHPFCLLL